MSLEASIANQSPQLKKHIGTVEISNPLNLIQRKAFSILLWNAYPAFEKGRGKMHEMPIATLLELLGYESNNLEHLDQSIGKLQSTLVSWVGHEDAFHRVTFFSYTGLKNGMYRYRFSPELEEKLYNPEIYARINVFAFREFHRRHTVALYENLARYRPTKDFVGGSPKWSLEEFKLLMGVDGSVYYEQFKELNRKIIVPAVEEINAGSDLIVTCIKIKKGRKIVGLKFEVADNPQQCLGLIPEPETAENAANNPAAIRIYELTGAPLLTTGQWVVEYGEDRINEVADMLEDGIINRKIKKPLGYVTRALAEGWNVGRSAEYVRSKLKKSTKITAKNWPEPDNWQSVAPGNLSNQSWNYVTIHYPDIADDIFKKMKC
jgi:hypothetical protein